jgi:hypothetical protein
VVARKGKMPWPWTIYTTGHRWAFGATMLMAAVLAFSVFTAWLRLVRYSASEPRVVALTCTIDIGDVIGSKYLGKTGSRIILQKLNGADAGEIVLIPDESVQMLKMK